MDALDHNMDVIADYYGDRHSKLRGHSKNHKSPALALRQIQRGGTIGGVCAAKVAEAEVMVEGGVASVFVTSEVVAPPKIARLCALADHAEILVACENEANAHDLSQVAASQGVNLGVVIEQETGLLRCGVHEVEPGLALARLIDSLPGLSLKGVMSHQMMSEPSSDREDRATEAHRLIQPVLDLREAMIAAGLPVEIVSTGETWSYDIAGDMPEVTEIQGGSYLVMETSYEYIEDFQLAGKVLTSIISVPRQGTAIGDAGARAVGGMKGLPRVEGRPGVEAVNMDTDRTVFQVAEGAELAVGDQVMLLPGQQDAMVSRWDRFIGIRDGMVEAVWDIEARGCHN
ncbi:3-hydroxy-D-aspartate aldolase [Geodia barretti]|uniref:3-hydroxy-D-aspartate aldolase n=1 Tax=Geodia barretti TaxID=519541 RepID=A0AA35WI72_GEOBA|nr:3-hydroxy-D-aspartate aldolase [Geodia barretti]